jgi:hypothetical protein
VRHLLKAICLVLAAAISAAAGQTPDSAATVRDAALAADARYDTTAALAALDNGLKRFPNNPGLFAAKGRIYWRLMRTKSAEQVLRSAAKSPASAAEANYFLGRIYDFKGSQAEGAFPGFHEEVNYRPMAAAAFKVAGAPKPEWTRTLDGVDAAVKAADAEIARLQSSSLPEPQLQPQLRAAIEKRIAIRPDPAAYIANANLILTRKKDLLFAQVLSREGVIAGERFIDENQSSYKLDGKVQASLDRNRAVFADIQGWAKFLLGDRKGAETDLAEASRLYRNLDATNQLHLAELSTANNDLENAREHFLTALGLAGITAPQREQATKSLAAVQAKNGENPAEFEKWLTTTLDRRREERRRALVSDMQGRKLPNLVLKDLQGRNVDLRAERGNVVLLNFFSAW